MNYFVKFTAKNYQLLSNRSTWKFPALFLPCFLPTRERPMNEWVFLFLSLFFWISKFGKCRLAQPEQLTRRSPDEDRPRLFCPVEVFRRALFFLPGKSKF